MNDGNETKENRTLSIVVVLMMLMMVVQVPFSDASDTSYAASSDAASLGSINIVAFDQESTDYSLLAYMNDRLPTQLNAAEWAYHSGLWYNVNSLSSDYGKTLRYGMITGIGISEIRSDVASFFGPPFTYDSFTVVQVEYTVNAPCNVSFEIYKDGVSVCDHSYVETMDRGGYRVVSSINQLVPFSVAPSGADINVTDVNGDYSVEAKYDGIPAGSKSFTYSGSAFPLGGEVVDAGGDPIKGVEIRYVIRSDDTTSASIVESGSKFTADDGSFIIHAYQGQVAEITSVSRAGLTFPLQTYNYGTIDGPSLGFTFESKEYMVKVTVKDASDRAAVGVPVEALWFTSVYFPPPTSKYVISTSGAGIYCNSVSVSVVTDADGVAYIAVDDSQKPAGAKLYVKGGACNYTMSTDPNMNAGEHNDDLPDAAHLQGVGNRYIDTSTYDDVVLVTDDRSVEVTVVGSKDSNLNGGAVLQDVQVEVGWYFEAPSPGGSGYVVRAADEPMEPGTFQNLSAGRAWLLNSFTDAEGNVIVCYIEPKWTVASGEKAYLYVRAVAGAPSSPSAEYTFNSTEPSDGPKAVAELDSESLAAIGLLKGSVPNTAEVSSDDVAYTISGIITGDVPDMVTVYCMYGTSGRFVDAFSDGTDIEFNFVVKGGTSNIIEINSVDGYNFTPSRYSLPTAYSDQAFSSVAESSVSVLSRDDPDTVSEYRIEGVEAGDVVDFRYSVGGNECSVTVVADSDPLIMYVKGWAGCTVSGLIVSGNGLYIDGFVYDPLGGFYASSASKIVDRKYVTYYNPVSDIPTIDNIVGMQTIGILCDGALYTSVVSDQNGLISVAVPDVGTLTYMFGSLSVVATPISGGAYDGFYAINLKDVIAPIGPKQVSMTVRYIATSSLQNAELPTNVDVLNGPMDLVLDVGTMHTLVAPKMNGFTFSGWYIDGESASDLRDSYSCTFSVTDELEGVTITASYSAVTPEPPKEDIGTIVAIGMVSVTIALIALIYVILQIRRN